MNKRRASKWVAAEAHGESLQPPVKQAHLLPEDAIVIHANLQLQHSLVFSLSLASTSLTPADSRQDWDISDLSPPAFLWNRRERGSASANCDLPVIFPAFCLFISTAVVNTRFQTKKKKLLSSPLSASSGSKIIKKRNKSSFSCHSMMTVTHLFAK